MDAAQPYAFANEHWVSDVSAVSAKKYSQDFLLKFAKQCTDLPKRFEITTDIVDGLMSANIRSHVLQRDSHSHPFTRIITDRSGAMDRRGSGVMKEGNFGVFGNPRTPMRCPMQVIHKAEKYELGIVADEEEGKQRQLEAILNKLTPQNFEMLVEQVIAVNIDNVVALDGLVSQIIEKALMKPTFCEMYANLCLNLSAAFPLFSQYDEKISFKKLLVNKCQVEFERGEREKEEANEADEEREEKRAKGRRRVLGSIRLIGELYKKKMLTERIMHMCIIKLLGSYQDSDEDVEALCELMGTIGEMIDYPGNKELMDAYFERMRSLSNNMNLSFKERIMLKDVITLRNNKWKQRRNIEGSMDTAQPDAIASTVTTKKYSRDFLLKLAGQCTDLPEGFEIAAGIAEGLVSANISSQRDSHSHPFTRTITSRSGAMDRRGSGVMNKGNFGVLGNPCIQTTMQSPLQVMHKAEKYELAKVADKEEGKQRQLEAILNKLTPQNFEMLVEQVIAVNIYNVVTLDGLVSQIFEKALMEPTFCEMYIIFCFHLVAALSHLSLDNEKMTFKKLLANKCQVEFERGEREEEQANEADEEREEKRAKGRRRVLGNIRLIGELYKKKMLPERIMHECIKKLLGPYQDYDDKDVEALCELMSTIGEMIDYPNNKELMDAYFERMRSLSNNMNLSSKERIMLKDVITLRNNKWKQRRNVEGSMDTAQPDAVASSVTAKKYSRDFLLKFAGQCTDLPEGFEITAGIAEDLMFAVISDDVIEDDSYLYTGRITYKPGMIIQMQQGASCVIKEDKWRKDSSTFRSSMHLDGAGGNTGFRPGQGGNFGVSRNPHTRTPKQSPLQMMHKAEKCELGKMEDEKEAKQRQSKAVLDDRLDQLFSCLQDLQCYVRERFDHIDASIASLDYRMMRLEFYNRNAK